MQLRFTLSCRYNSQGSWEFLHVVKESHITLKVTLTGFRATRGRRTPNGRFKLLLLSFKGLWAVESISLKAANLFDSICLVGLVLAGLSYCKTDLNTAGGNVCFACSQHHIRCTSCMTAVIYSQSKHERSSIGKRRKDTNWPVKGQQ